MKTYKPIDLKIWKGRIDSCTDAGCMRWHQVIHTLDLRDANTVPSTPKGFTYIVFLGFCCDEGVRRHKGRAGAAKGPHAIRKAMAVFPVHSNERVQFFDAGDIICKAQNMEQAQADLALAVQIIKAKGMTPVVLGGGHEMALGHGLGLLEESSLQKRKKSLGIVNFDAHFDLSCLIKKKGTSATAFMQLFKQFKAYKQKYRYCCLGIQESANTECFFKKAGKFGVTYILREDFTPSKMAAVKRKIGTYLKSVDQVYVTVCADVFAQSFAPGVSEPQVFGIYPEEFFSAFQYLLKSKKVISLDIAGVSPVLDRDGQTAALAARVVFEFVSGF